MRHVDPRGRVGSRVEAGHVVAAVTVWDDGTDHLHLEIWRSLGGGYVFENMIDPFPVAWDPEPDPKPFYFEDAPRPGRRRAGARLAWPQPERGGAARAERASRDLGRTATTVKDDEGVFHVLWWAGSAPAAEYRFGG